MLISFLLLSLCINSQLIPFESRIGELTYIAKDISTARTLLTDPSGNLLTIARGSQSVYAFWEDGTIFRSMIILDGSTANLAFSHGLAYDDGYLYISSDTTVWRWRYDHTRRTVGI
jgi:hypothetical protein